MVDVRSHRGWLRVETGGGIPTHSRVAVPGTRRPQTSDETGQPGWRRA